MTFSERDCTFDFRPIAIIPQILFLLEVENRVKLRNHHPFFASIFKFSSEKCTFLFVSDALLSISIRKFSSASGMSMKLCILVVVI